MHFNLRVHGIWINIAFPCNDSTHLFSNGYKDNWLRFYITTRVVCFAGSILMSKAYFQMTFTAPVAYPLTL